MDNSGYRKTIAVHRLYAGDKDAIRDHLLRLDVHARRSRFFGTVTDSGISKYAKNILRDDCIICGAWVHGKLRGLAELRGSYGAWPSTTEVAFSVETDWQNIGIGDALFERIFAVAQNRGVRTLQMMCLKENNRMQHLAVKHHAHLHYRRDAVEAVLHPHWPTPMSVAKEIIGETKGYAQTFLSVR